MAKKKAKTKVEIQLELPFPPNEKRELSDTRLSYSSYTTVKSCEQKYWHYKVNNTPQDIDFDDNKDSLVLGKAFHTILELTQHTSNGLAQVIKDVQSGANIEGDRMALVVAMVKVYLNFKETHKVFSRLTPIAIELQLTDDNFIGFIDVVFKDLDSPKWYLGDLKTTARQSETLKAKLGMDAQLHLYSSYANQVAEKLGLDLKDFSGALYIATNKTTTKRKSEEALSAYVNRLEKVIETRIYVVPMDAEKTKWVKDDFNTFHARTNDLRKGLVPVRNYSQCENYFTPCPYFSKCHGHNYSQATMEIWSSAE